MREITQNKIDAWKKDSKTGTRTIANSDFAHAVLKTAKRNEEKSKHSDNDKDFDRDR